MGEEEVAEEATVEEWEVLCEGDDEDDLSPPVA